MKKKKNNSVPAPSKLNLLRQICNFIPEFLVPKLARETGVDKKVRKFSAWSHVVSLLYAQLTHSIGLNDVCDALGLRSGPLSSLRGATPPTRNNLSHANKVRPAEMAEKLFWAVFEHLGKLSPRFISGRAGKRFARRFKRAIHVVDSTTIQLIASCMDWARHRRRKAAAKCHLRLDLQSFLPRFAIVDTAQHNDAKRARELCAGIKPGEIVIFDKAGGPEHAPGFLGHPRQREPALQSSAPLSKGSDRPDSAGRSDSYLLLRYLTFLSDWSHSFSRLFTLLRASLWQKWDVLVLLKRYGTADGQFRYLGQPEQAYLPGFG